MIALLRNLGQFLVFLWILFAFACLIAAMADRAAKRREREQEQRAPETERGGETARLYALPPAWDENPARVVRSLIPDGTPVDEASFDRAAALCDEPAGQRPPARTT